MCCYIPSVNNHFHKTTKCRVRLFLISVFLDGRLFLQSQGINFGQPSNGRRHVCIITRVWISSKMCSMSENIIQTPLTQIYIYSKCIQSLLYSLNELHNQNRKTIQASTSFLPSLINFSNRVAPLAKYTSSNLSELCVCL